MTFAACTDVSYVFTLCLVTCLNLGFSNLDLGSGLEILPYERFSPVTGIKSEWHRLALPVVHPHHKRYSFKSCRIYNSRESYNFCVSSSLICFLNLGAELFSRICGLFSSDINPDMNPWPPFSRSQMISSFFKKKIS